MHSRAPAGVARAGRSGSFRPSLAVFLATLVLVSVLPALLMGAWSAWEAARAHRRTFEVGMMETARALAAAADAQLGARMAALTALAASPELDEGGRLDVFYRLASSAARALDTWFILSAPDGPRQVINTLRPYGAPLPTRPVLDSGAAVVTAIEKGRPAVSDISPRPPVSGRPGFIVSVPVQRDGRTLYALSAAMDAAQLVEPLRSVALQDGAFASLSDGRGQIVARSVDHAGHVGRPVPEWYARAAAGRDDGILDGPSLDGGDMVLAFARLRVAPGWTVVVAQPRRVQTESWRTPLLRLAAGGALALALGSAFALAFGRGLLRPVRALARQAEAVASAGGKGAELAAAPPFPVRELEALRRSLAQADAALRTRAEAEASASKALAASEERVRLATEGMELGIWDVDLGSDEGVGTPTLFAIYGLARPPDGKVSRAHLDRCLHPDDRLRAEAEEARARAAASFWRIEHRIRRADDGAERWVEVHGRHVFDGARTRLLGVVRDVTERRAAEERQELLAREVDHRAKNALAVVQSVVRLTRAQDPAAFRSAVEGRVGALARTHSLLARDRWTGADLRGLLEGELAPFRSEGQRVTLDGPPVLVRPEAAQALAMAAHELATNAVKHGALSVPGGSLEVAWEVGGGARETLDNRWTEHGGPPVEGMPARRGFGSRVLEGTVAQQLGGRVELGWEGSGLRARLSIPLRRADPAARDE